MQAALAKEIDPDHVLLGRQFSHLHRIILGLDPEPLQDALEKSSTCIDSRDRDGRTPLFWAIYRGNTNAIKTLVDFGADSNQDPSCLVWACSDKFEQPDCLRALLNNGAPVGGYDFDGFTALQASVINKRSTAFQLLLIEAGAAINQTYRGDDPALEGYTALSFACLHGSPTSSIEILLEHGSELNCKDYRMRSLLHLAVAKAPNRRGPKNSKAIVRVLLRAGHTLDCLDDSGNTAAHDAIVKRDVGSLTVLMAGGANIVHPTDRGSSTSSFYKLAWLVETNNHMVLKCLLAQSSTELTDTSGDSRNTILHLFAQQADRRSITLLEEQLSRAQPNPDQLNADGFTPSDYAQARPEDIAKAMNVLLQRIRRSRVELASTKGRYSKFHSATILPEAELESDVDSVSSGKAAHKDFALNEEYFGIDSGYASYESEDQSDEEANAQRRRPTIASRQEARGLNGRSRKSLTTAKNTVREPTNDVKVARDLTGPLSKLRKLHQDSAAERPFSAFERMLGTLKNCVELAMSFRSLPLRRIAAILLRPRVPEGHNRITWNCVSTSSKCISTKVDVCSTGTELHADYPDTDLESVAKLSQELNYSFATSGAIESGNSAANSPTQPPARPCIAYLPNPHIDPTGNTQMDQASNSNTISSLMPHVDSQQSSNLTQHLLPRYFEPFRWIRRRYKDIRGWRTQTRFCLRPKSIKVVYFGFEQMKTVHILDESFSPEREVTAARYHLDPSPPKPTWSTPMPSNIFVLYLQYCNLDVDVLPTQKTWLNRLPKKMRHSVVQEGSFQDHDTLIEAWGVHVVEGVDTQALLWTIIFTVTITNAPVLGMYIAMTGNVQNGAAIAGLVLTVTFGLWMCIQVDQGKHS